MTSDDELGGVRDAIARQDWRDAFDQARALRVDDQRREADRLDLEAEAAWWLGRLDDCIAAREAAYRAYDELGDQRRAGQSAVWLWEHHAISARPSIAGAWLRRARVALEGDPDCVEYGNLLLREAETAHGQGDLATAEAAAEAALALGRSRRDVDLEAEALQTRGRIRIDRGQIAVGMGDLDDAMLFAAEGRLRPFSTGKVYCSLIAACEEIGDFDRAAEWTEATMRWAERHPFAIWPGICRVHRAIVLKRRGDLEGAEQEAERACEELRRSHVGNSAAAYAEMGDIQRRLGDLDRAEAAFARYQELTGGTCGGLALLRLAQGRVDVALGMITGCLERTVNPMARTGLLPVFVHVAIAAGHIDDARAATVELAEHAALAGTPSLAATLLATRGRVELAGGDPAAAVTLEQAATSWRALDVPYEEATARTLLGQARRAVGDETAAAEAFAEAARLFDEIGAHLDARLVLGGGRRARPSGLTEREVEVLQLLATGLTNNEIAGELHLSAKTVSRHLSNIFTKIGVSSRAGATAFAFEQHLVDPR